MGKTLYLECHSGLSGDMTAAALLDLGADREALEKALKSLPVNGFETEIRRVKKAGLDVCDFYVKLDTEHENHDHDMDYLFGHGSHGHHHEEEAAHPHGHAGHGHLHAEGNLQETLGHGHFHEGGEHPHGHAGHGHLHAHADGYAHEHRGLPEILEMIDQAEMTGRAKDTAARIFHILAQAESKAHGLPEEQVHFHEVGAVDSIVDIVTVAVCLDSLDVTDVIVPFVYEGRGSIRCQHGILPVPVPAVANIVQAHRIPMRITDMEAELVTPTGAAIVAAIRTSGRLPEEFIVAQTGIGAGKRNYEKPSLLRAMLLEETEAERRDTICKLETNIDDCTGEILGYVMQKLLEAGARDVYYTPSYMKKNRPAYELNVICDEVRRAELEQIIFRETTTIGIRRVQMERTVLRREIGSVMLPWGELAIKRCTLPDGSEKCYPEYESAAELAGKSGMTLQQVMDEGSRYK